jgi:hypothetical protein
MMRLARLGCATALVLLVGSALSGCTSSSSANVIARNETDAAAAAVARSAAAAAVGPRQADFLLASSIPPSPALPPGVTMEALTWSGNSGSAAGARFVVRISEVVDAKDAVDVGGTSNDAGSATQCYEITVVLKA